jgi:hypothetical protein
MCYLPKDFECGNEGLTTTRLPVPLRKISFDPFGNSAMARVARRGAVVAEGLGTV